MTLTFPNPSRSFDPDRDCICFWGYDRTIEVVFFLEVSALQRLCPDLGNNVAAGCLQAFDRVRDRIEKTAAKVYARGRGAHACRLTTEDF